MIIADIREPERYQKMAHESRDIGVDFLVIGDRRKYAVERKTVMDLVSSVRDGRLFDQLEQLKKFHEEEGYQPILIVEGTPYVAVKYKRMTYAEWVGYQIGIAGWSVPTIHVPSESLVKYVLEKLDEKACSKEKLIIRLRGVPKKMGRTLEDERLSVLCAIQGIGVRTAQKLLVHFKTLLGVFTAEKEMLESVIGDRLAAHVKEVVEG